MARNHTPVTREAATLTNGSLWARVCHSSGQSIPQNLSYRATSRKKREVALPREVRGSALWILIVKRKASNRTVNNGATMKKNQVE